MKKLLTLILLVSFWWGCRSSQDTDEPIVQNSLRAPAYPLITIDPYTSGWSFSDKLYESPVRHWTGKEFPLTGAIKVDGQVFRFMGTENEKIFKETAVQTNVDVQPTQTHYYFICGPVNLKLTFTAPLFPDDPELLAKPINYITYEVTSNDSKKHNVAIYFEASPAWALNDVCQQSISEGFESNDLFILRTGSMEQNILGKRGDDLRIDWGYFYMAAEKKNTVYSIGLSRELRVGFMNGIKKESVNRRENSGDNIVITRNLGKVKEKVTGKLMLGYDDIYSIRYFGKNLRPYWNRKGNASITQLLSKASREHETILHKAYAFDKALMEDACNAGGKEYAELCALAYRQAISAHKLVESPEGDLLFLSKENFSNGSVGTVDVAYPAAPLLLYYNVELAKGLLNPIFYYCESAGWHQPFPPHDIGTYPWANGQTYGADMPVEEAGNMLLLTTLVSALERNTCYAERYWGLLTRWADYLVENGFDPDDQLCTDDFAGHWAHNTNLSVKAILGIAGYGYMADLAGKKEVAAKYTAIAREFAQKWVEKAHDGDHYRLAFDRPGTWSQKYNLVWDKLLKLDIFPVHIAETEISYYLTRQNTYGLPLDNRASYTKTDWIFWTATLADNKDTFQTFIRPVHRFMNETVNRVPMSDWVYTDKPEKCGFRARSVVGGYYIKMLYTKLNTP